VKAAAQLPDGSGGMASVAVSGEVQSFTVIWIVSVPVAEPSDTCIVTP